MCDVGSWTPFSISHLFIFVPALVWPGYRPVTWVFNRGRSYRSDSVGFAPTHKWLLSHRISRLEKAYCCLSIPDSPGADQPHSERNASCFCSVQLTPGIRPYARCHYHAPGHTMGAYQAYYGGKGHTMVGSGTGILWQYFMNTLFLAPHRRRSHNRRRHNTRSAQRAPLCSRPTTTTQLYIQSVLRCMMP